MAIPRSLAALVCGLVLAGAGSAQAVLLYGMDHDSNQLLTVETRSGAVSLLGELPGARGSLGGLDFDAGGQLYVLKTFDGLYRVDARNGSGALVGGQAGRVFESFEIVGRRGYAADVFDEGLYRINLGTGRATLLGSYSQDPDLDERVTGLAWGGGALYGTRFYQRDIVRLDPRTGAVLEVVGTHGLGNLTSLAWANGRLWGIPALTNDLYAIDPLTAHATLVRSGLADVPHITGLTSPVPEPGAFMLGLAAAPLLLAWSRWRRRAAP